MTHSTHHMDQASLDAHATIRPTELRAKIIAELSKGVPRTAKELVAIIGSPLVSTRSRLSDGCNPERGEPVFRKAVRVEEEGSAVPVWAFGLAEVPAGVT